MALKWKAICVGPFAMNAYLVWCDETRQALIVDPGDEIDRLARGIEAENLHPLRIVLTHAHLDHVLRASVAQARFNLELHMHRDDLQLLQNVPTQASMLGLRVPDYAPPRVDGYLSEGDNVSFGNQVLRVVHGPGHSPGSIMLFGKEMAVVGDVLFQGSIGRTDLPGGSYEVLMKTLHEKLMVLSDEVIVLPGHGEASTIGQERRHNPFLR